VLLSGSSLERHIISCLPPAVSGLRSCWSNSAVQMGDPVGKTSAHNIADFSSCMMISRNNRSSQSMVLVSTLHYSRCKLSLALSSDRAKALLLQTAQWVVDSPEIKIETECLVRAWSYQMAGSFQSQPRLNHFSPIQERKLLQPCQ
jgi:hypothetical protein